MINYNEERLNILSKYKEEVYKYYKAYTTNSMLLFSKRI